MIKDLKFVCFSSGRFELSALLINGFDEIFFELNTICEKFIILNLLKHNFFRAIWSSGNVFVSGAGGLSFKSRACQIGRSVANARHSCATFLRKDSA